MQVRAQFRRENYYLLFHAVNFHTLAIYNKPDSHIDILPAIVKSLNRSIKIDNTITMKPTK